MNQQTTADGRGGLGVWCRDPVLLSLVAVALVTGVAFGFQLGGRTAQVVAFWVVTGALELLLAVLARRVSRVPRLDDATRRMWRAMSFTGLSYAVGVCLQAPVVWRDPHSLAAALGGPAYSIAVLVGTLWLIWTMLTSPLGLRGNRERLRFWLDVGTVMVAAATVSCYFAYRWNVEVAAGPLAKPMELLIGPTAFLVGVFAVVKLLLGGRAPFTLLAGVLGATAATLEGAVRGLRPAFVANDRVAWELGLTVVVVALLAASARAQQLHARTRQTAHGVRPKRPYSVLPYVAIVATYLLLVVVLAVSGLDANTWIVVVGAITSTALVVVRQLAAFTDNARLLAELDSKVAQLNAALSQRDELAAQLRHQAFHDNLTGLANRALFLRRLQDAARLRDPAIHLAVILIDLDDFKPINDEFGHAAGDRVLIEVGARLRSCVRDADTVARLGGDEFAVLIEPLSPLDDLARIAERMVRSVQAPVRIADTDAVVTASVGATRVTPGAHPPTDVLQQADTAMYEAKNGGKGTFKIFQTASVGTP